MTDRIADLDDVERGEADDGAGARSADQLNEPSPADATATPPVAAGSPWQRYRQRRRNRVSKWDRPPDPKDWRYFVGTLGKVLISTGILMFGFVAYQLWGTGLETARAQNRLEDAFALAIAAGAQDEPADDPVGNDTAEPDEAPGTTAGGNRPDTTVVDATGDGGPLPELPDPVPSEVVPGGVDLSDVAVDQEIPPIDRGDVIARLQIPRIDQDLYVVAGVTLEDLKDGPGHYPDTPLPGQLGNAAIAGHRTTYGAPFFDVDQLAAGDELIVTSITGDQYVYAVTGVQVVSASDYWVVTTRDPNVAELTLTSCHPKYTARDRIVVHSVLVPERSSNVGVAEFYELGVAGTGAVPGDDPPLVPHEPTATEPSDDGIVATIDPDAGVDLVGTDEATPAGEAATAPPPTTRSEAAAAPTTTPPDEPVEQVPAAPEPGTVDRPEQIDAFSQGWFDDDEAWPQIALWGFALTIISLLAYQVSKRTRHDSIGFAVGVAPFLVSLYFFFQNVNRLLPPGL